MSYIAAQIGGLLGLALGFSLISGAEMLYHLLLRCCAKPTVDNTAGGEDAE